MTKLCPRGKAAAKRKFRVYPSAYANAYASKICAGKIKDPSGVKRKDSKQEALDKLKKELGMKAGGIAGSLVPKTVKKLKNIMGAANRDRGKEKARVKKMGGGLMEATERLRRQGLRGGGLCKRGMNREAIGKNS